MRRHVVLYGLLAGGLVVLLRLVEYRSLILLHSIELYGGLVALIFASVGIWLGVTLTGRPERVVVREITVTDIAVSAAEQPGGPFVADPARRTALGITPRELEILELMAAGLSNKEIGARLFVSENTVKTHGSRLFDKLGAKRRTQAVQLGKAHGLIA